VTSARIIVLATLAALGVSCRSGPPPAIDPVLAERVPAAATVLGGADLERVRSSHLYQELPPAARAFLETLSGAHSVLVASDGGNLLVLTRGDFKKAPPGATLLGQGLAAAGSPDWVRAAASRHVGDRNGLLAHAEPLAAMADMWMVAAGSANLPFTGNGENAGRLLHATEYATLTARLTDRVSLAIVGMCRGPDSARRVEETVRSYATLGAAGEARQPAVSGLLRRIQVSRDGSAVRVTLVARADELKAFF